MLKLIAQFGGEFVLLGFDGVFELATEDPLALDLLAFLSEDAGVFELGLCGAACRETARDFADVLGSAFVGTLEQRQQERFKRGIAIRASEKTGLTELLEREAAGRAGGRLGFGRFGLWLFAGDLRQNEVGQEFIERRARSCETLFGGTGFAAVNLDPRAIAKDGVVDGCFLIASIALHGKGIHHRDTEARRHGGTEKRQKD